jgi:hypothetical protein
VGVYLKARAVEVAVFDSSHTEIIFFLCVVWSMEKWMLMPVSASRFTKLDAPYTIWPSPLTFISECDISHDDIYKCSTNKHPYCETICFYTQTRGSKQICFSSPRIFRTCGLAHLRDSNPNEQNIVVCSFWACCTMTPGSDTKYLQLISFPKDKKLIYNPCPLFTILFASCLLG